MGNSNSNIRIDIEAGVNPAGFNAGVEQIDRVGAAVQRVNQPMVEAERSANKLQLTAGQLSMATRQLPMQFTDIWTSLASGQPPMMVLIQQGGQLKDSFGGVVPAAKAMGAYIMGMFGPLTATSSAIAAQTAATLALTEAEVQQTAIALASARANNALGMSHAQVAAAETAHAAAVARLEAAQAASVARTGLLSRALGFVTSPLGAITLALGAGAAAWYVWGDKADEATSKALSNLDKLKKAADAAARPTSQESLFNLKSMAQSAEIEADFYAKRAREDGRSAELKRIDAESAGKARQLAEGLRRQAQEVEDQIAQKAEAESKRNQRGYRQSDAGKAERDYQQITEAATGRIAVLEAQAKATDKLTQSEKDLIEFDKQHKPSLDKRIEQQRLATRSLLDKAAALERTAQAQQAAAKAREEANKGAAVVDGLARDYSAEINKKNRDLNAPLMSAADKAHADNLDAVTASAARAREKIAELNVSEETRAQLIYKVNQAESEQQQKMEDLRKQIERNNASWEYGANVALRSYLDEATNVAKQSERLFSTAFKSAEDAITKAMMTGKLSVRDFANATIEEFYRIKVAQPMVSAGANFLGDLFGNLAGSLFGAPSVPSAPTPSQFSLSSGGSSLGLKVPGRASGGTVDPNTLYRVNEIGPELLNYGGNDYLMMGGRGGFVKPVSSQPAAVSAAQAAPSVVVQVINQSGQNVNARQQGGPQFDGRNWVLGIVLDAADSDPQFRNAMGLGRG